MPTAAALSVLFLAIRWYRTSLWWLGLSVAIYAPFAALLEDWKG